MVHSNFLLLIIYNLPAQQWESSFHHPPFIYSSLPLTLGNLFQDPRLMPETTDGTKPYVYYLSTCT